MPGVRKLTSSSTLKILLFADCQQHQTRSPKSRKVFVVSSAGENRNKASRVNLKRLRPPKMPRQVLLQQQHQALQRPQRRVCLQAPQLKASIHANFSLLGPTNDSPAPQPASADLNKAPQLSEPSQSELAKDIDLNPTASDVKAEPSTGMAEPPKPISEPPVDKAEAPKATTEKPTVVTETATKPTQTSTGMSATSGPLGDHMEEGFIDDGLDVGPKGETAPVAEKMDRAEKIEEVQKTKEMEKLEEGGMPTETERVE